MPEIKAQARRPESLGPWLSLAYSRAFFHAFPFRENRVEQWRLVYALVAERKPKLTRKRLNEILDETLLGNEHKLVTKLLFDQQRRKCLVLQPQPESGNGDDEAAFITEKEKRTSRDDIDLDTLIILEPYLYEKLERYVEEFLRCMLQHPPSLDRTASLDLMHEVYEFQVWHANPAWNLFLEELRKEVEKTPKLDSAKFRRELRESSEHWLLLHGLMALSQEGEAAKWTNSELLNFISAEVTTFVKDRKFKAAIVHLDTHGVLAVGRVGKEKVYGISPAFQQVFDRYNIKLISMRNELVKILHPLLEGGTESGSLP